MQWLEELKMLKGRGEIKRWGQRVDSEASMREELILALRERGEQVQQDLPGKKLIRRWLSRSEGAQVRRNPIHVNESFECIWCGMENRLSSKIRDHCSRCLRSIHLDVVPGDRSASCGALMHPTALTLVGGQVRIEYRCESCGHEHQIWSHPDDQIPSSLSIAELYSRKGKEN